MPPSHPFTWSRPSSKKRQCAGPAAICLTKSSKRQLRIVNGVFIVLIPLAFAFFAAALTINSSDQADPTIVGILTVLALLSLTIGILGGLYIAPRFGPTGVVMGRTEGYYDYLVELRRVHPFFVVAVQEQQQLRAAKLRSGTVD